MAEEHDQERSHAPTPRRLEQARAEGQIARSRDLASVLLLLPAAALALWGGQALAGSFGLLLQRGLVFGREAAFDPAKALAGAAALSMDGLMLVLPVLAIFAALALAGPLMVGGWLFIAKPFMPDLMRLSPARWAKQTFSTHGLIELVKTVAKTIFVSAAAMGAAWALREDLAALLSSRGTDAIALGARLAGIGFLSAAAAMLAIAAIDVPAQLWRHHQSLRMSTEEVKRDSKETDGDPHIKQRIRNQQREIARRRMMADVPRADVVVVNPQHYAVALAWKETGMRAPKVVAKGVDLVAARIREVAGEHGVPVLEAPPLARALYSHAEIGDEIPARLYNAVAQVLAWTFALRAGRGSQTGPGEIEVPADMDPQAGKPT